MKKQTKVMWNVGLIGGLLLLLFVLEQLLPSGSMLFTVLKKGAIYGHAVLQGAVPDLWLLMRLLSR